MAPLNPIRGARQGITTDSFDSTFYLEVAASRADLWVIKGLSRRLH